ncbi:MAG: Fe-S cluster assembly sulfur transfer protein SufU [Verrucomicrobiales bacterium]
MNGELEELYQTVILDHSKRPRNFGELLDATARVTGDNPSCGDEIQLGVKLGADGRIEDVKFTGHGCAISQASASLMTIKVKGQGIDRARELIGALRRLVTTDDPPAIDQLGDLALLQGVRKFPQRVKCAMLAWRALEQALLENEAGRSGGLVSTETQEGG